jgi:PAS domain S-box-containing protein
VLVFRDVADRYQAARQAGLLSAIVTSSDDAIISKDLNGIITSWNTGAERTFGYTAEEIIGSSILRLIPDDRRQEETEIIARLRRGERLYHYETVRVRKDGQLCDISLTVSPITDLDGRVIGASKIARDITDQVRARRALHESKERLRVTLESIGDAVVTTDAQGVVTFSNPVAAELLGRPSTLLIGQPLSDVFKIVNEDTRQLVDSPVDRVIRDGVGVGLANHTVLLRPDGTELPIDDSGAPIRDDKGRLVGVVLVFRDILMRRQAELHLQRWNAELEARVLERTQKLLHSQERLRALASQLSLTEQRERRRLATDLHDFLAQILALARIKVSQMKQHLRDERIVIKTLVSEVDTMLNQCLGFTRTLMAQLSPSILHDLGLVPALRWLAEQMGQQALTVTVNAPAGEQPRFQENHADLVFQAVRELLLNVLKHAQVSEATVSVAKQTDDSWLITVEDHGIGFDVSAVHYRPSGEHFGLFSIQERIEAVSGSCVIESTPGQGTKVQLRLTEQRDPSRQTQTGGEKPAAAPASDPASVHPWRILLVDDHVMLRQGLRGLLETYPDLEVIAEASNGEEAVEYALRLRPEVVILDINLPRLSGTEATRRIKQSLPGTVIIGLSAQATPQTVKALVEAGAAAVLNKEDAVERLHGVIARFMERS